MIRSIGWVSVLALVLVAQSALADGGFSLSMRGQFGFSLLQLSERNGIRQGTLDGAQVGMQRTDKELVMVTGSQKEVLTVDKQGNNLYYRGWLQGASELSDFTYYPDKNGYRIKGSVSGTSFDLSVDNKKGDLLLWWTMKGDDDQGERDVEFDLNLKKMKTEAGGCEGSLYALSGMGSQEVAKIFCHSSGSMTDAFWTSPDDAIAWLIRAQVFPSDNRGD